MKIKKDKVKSDKLKFNLVKLSDSKCLKKKDKLISTKPAALALSFAENKVKAVEKKNKSKVLNKTLVNVSDIKTKNVHEGSQEVSQLHEGFKKKADRKAKKLRKTTKVGEDPTDNTILDNFVLPEIIVSDETVEKAIKACKTAIDESYDKKNLFGDDLKYGLQIASVKIPDVPSRNCRIQLPHPIYQQGDDICLIVKDLQRGRKYDYEETRHYWEDKLRECGVNYITQVIPFQQLKRDYAQYEMRNRLVNRFDRFLADARINDHVYHFLGHIFIKRCKNPTPVILDTDEKIDENLRKSLRKQTYKQTNTGNTTEIQFATHKMSLEKAIENAKAVIEYLKTNYPGGWLNIRSIYLKPMTDIPLTLPMYVSNINPNQVPVPKMTGPREKFEKRMNEKLNTITKSKYKFRAGNLVRVPFEQRKKKLAHKKRKQDRENTKQPEPGDKKQKQDTGNNKDPKPAEFSKRGDEKKIIKNARVSNTKSSNINDSD